MSRSFDRWLTPLDRALLERLAAEPNVVHAARALGIGRDRAVYRLARLRRLYRGPLVRGRRGGPSAGESRLTPLGRRLLAGAEGLRAGGNRFRGVYRRAPSPRVDLGGGASLEVAFRARDGATVLVELPAEAFVVARRPAALSARNALRVTVESLRPRRDDTVELRTHWAGRRLRVALTPGSVARLGLAAGAPAFLYAKAVAVRRITRGSPRS